MDFVSLLNFIFIVLTSVQTFFNFLNSLLSLLFEMFVFNLNGMHCLSDLINFMVLKIFCVFVNAFNTHYFLLLFAKEH